MRLKKYLMAGVFACLALPAWAVKAPETQSPPLAGTGMPARQIHTQIQTFIERVWADHPAVQARQAEVDAARVRAEGADRPLYNPELEFEAERTDINTTTIGIKQALDWKDRRGSLTDVALLEAEAATAELAVTRQHIVVETLTTLARYLAAKETQTLAEKRSELMKRFADTVEQRKAAGDMGALDVALARVAYSEAFMQEAGSKSDLVEAESALRAVTGLDVADWPRLPTEFNPPLPTSDKNELIEHLPQLIAARARMNAARARIRVAEKEQRPAPTIGLRGGREDKESLIGLTVEIPLLVRNSFKSEVRATAFEAVQEEQDYRDVYRRAIARFEGALGRFQNTNLAWRAWQTTGQRAYREQEQLLEQLWAAGELTSTDYLTQARQNVETGATAVALMGELWQAVIDWLDASGQIMQWLGADKHVPTNFGDSQ